MSYTSYAAIPVTDMNLMIPLVGLWVADIKMASALPAPAIGPLVLGNLILAGAVWRSATFGGVTSARIVGGFGGWSRSVSPRGYSLPFGIPLSMILSDVAIEVGEPPCAVVPDRIVGTSWARPPGPITAGGVLRYVAGPSWYVGASGTVTVGPRVPSVITSAWQAIAWDGAEGIMTVATEDPASWQPGATFASPFVTVPQTVAMVRHMSDNAGVGRMRIMVA